MLIVKGCVFCEKINKSENVEKKKHAGFVKVLFQEVHVFGVFAVFLMILSVFTKENCISRQLVFARAFCE